jgi:hypothetical protein
MKDLCPHFKLLRVASYRDGTDHRGEPMIREKEYCTHPESKHRFRRTLSSPAVCDGDFAKCDI